MRRSTDHESRRARGGEAERGLRGVSRREVLWGGAATAASLAATRVTVADPTGVAAMVQASRARSLWRQSFTTPSSPDVTVVEVGGWCWFSEGRTVISPSGHLYVGITVGGTGTSYDGAVELTVVDVRDGLRSTSARQRVVLDRPTPGHVGYDDHDNPGIGVTGDGGIVAMWAHHGARADLRWARGAPGGGPVTVQWPIRIPDALVLPGHGVSYGSVHRVEHAGVILAGYRGEGYSWNLLRSWDDGVTWERMGLIVVPPRYNERPYLKFASDGDRLWFAATEGHPRTYQPTSIRVASIEPTTGRILDVHGRALGRVGPPRQSRSAFLGGVPVTSIPFAYRCPSNADAWISDIRHIAGRPVVGVSLRGPRMDSSAGAWYHDHLRVAYGLDGPTWTRELVSHAGGELGGHPSEPDYSGLSALDPSTHNRIVVSTNVHPHTGVPLRSPADGRVHFEVWEMNRRSDGSGQWAATALTRNSTVDNVRPHIAVQGDTKILSWMRGRYSAPSDFHTGIVSRQAA